MTITVRARHNANSFGENNLEAFIGAALPGTALNTQGFYEAHQADSTYGFLTQSVTLDDPAFGSTNNFLSFTHSTSTVIQHGIMADLVFDGGLTSEDSYFIRGLRLAGTATTITSFNMGMSLFKSETAIFPNPPSYGPTSLVDSSGSAGDNYYVNRGGLPNSWSGFTWNLTQFLQAAAAYRAGDGTLLATLLNAETFLFKGSVQGDYFYGYAQADTLFGYEGYDTLRGGGGNDIIDGGIGNDVLSGENGNDLVRGGDGDDTIDGGADNDTIYGGLGTNTIEGGQGNDLYILGDGADLITDAGGYDTIRFTNASTINFMDGFGAGDPSNDVWDDDFIERFEGSLDDDMIILTFAGGGSKEIYGRHGSDILGGRAADDSIYGGEGHDFLYGRDGADLLSGGTGNDELNGDAGNDILQGGRGNDTLNGGANRDTADFSDHFGNASGGWYIDLIAQTAYTQSSTATVLVTETDTLSSIEAAKGSNGRDTFQAAPRSTVDGGNGVDTLILAPTMPFLTFTQAADDRVDLAAGISVRGPVFSTNPETVTFSNIEIIHTNIGNDTVLGSAFVDTVYGDAGNDFISGLDSNDRIYGGLGNDQLLGGAGNDTFGYTALDEGGDTIEDFHNDLGDNDRLTFELADVGNIGVTIAGVTYLNDVHFQAESGALAQSLDIRFIYDLNDGALYYDADGSGVMAALHIATLTSTPTLTSADIVLV